MKDHYPLIAGLKRVDACLIRSVRIILSLSLLVIYCAFRREYGVMLVAAYVIMITGPVLLLSYFFLTIVEIFYYKKLARKG